MKEREEMIDTNEMARITGLKPMTLYHWAEQGKTPWDLYQVGSTKRVAKKSDVLAWLEAVRIPAFAPVNY